MVTFKIKNAPGRAQSWKTAIYHTSSNGGATLIEGDINLALDAPYKFPFVDINAEGAFDVCYFIYSSPPGKYVNLDLKNIYEVNIVDGKIYTLDWSTGQFAMEG